MYFLLIIKTRKPHSIIVKVNGKDLEYEILNVCEFNSTRKRMSTIVRCPNGEIKIYTKGADTVIFERLSKDNNIYMDTTIEHLEVIIKIEIFINCHFKKFNIVLYFLILFSISFN